MAICSRSRAGTGWLLAASLLLAACDSPPQASTAPPQPLVGEVTATVPIAPPPPPPLAPTPLPTPTPQRAYSDCYQPSRTTAATVADHRCTWWYEALRQQNRLDDDQPLQRSFWLASHNAYNSSAYPGVSSSGDPNHTLSLPDQLRLGFSSLELDLHWFFHAPSAGMAPVLCHALGASTNHLGCGSSDRHFREGLLEIAAFLRAPENADAVLMIDIEDQLQQFVPPNGSADSPAGHAAAVAAIEQTLGDLVYKPVAGGGCQPMPLSLTKQAMRAAGAKLILTSGCNANGGWNDWIFDIGSIRHQKANDGYAAAPECGAPFFMPSDYSSRWTRVWHDSTQLGAQTNANLQPIDAPTLESMVACGLHMPSLDLIVANDARAEASIWSWSLAQPAPSSAPVCAQLRPDGHFHGLACGQMLPVACRVGQGWRSSSAAGLPQDGPSLCAATAPGAVFGVPANAADAASLRAALGTNPAVWLNYFDSTGQGDWRRIIP